MRNQSGRSAPPFPVHGVMVAPGSAVPASFLPVTDPASCLIPFTTNLSWRRPAFPSGPACIGGACAATAGPQDDSVVLPHFYFRLAGVTPQCTGSKAWPLLRALLSTHQGLVASGCGRLSTWRCWWLVWEPWLRAAGRRGATFCFPPTLPVPSGCCFVHAHGASGRGRGWSPQEWD